MLSYSSTHHERRSYSVDEVVDAVFADDDTADEYMQSESSGSSEVATPEPIGGNVVRRGPETRNWRSQRILSRAEIRDGKVRKIDVLFQILLLSQVSILILRMIQSLLNF